MNQTQNQNNEGNEIETEKAYSFFWLVLLRVRANTDATELAVQKASGSGLPFVGTSEGTPQLYRALNRVARTRNI